MWLLFAKGCCRYNSNDSIVTEVLQREGCRSGTANVSRIMRDQCGDNTSHHHSIDIFIIGMQHRNKRIVESSKTRIICRCIKNVSVVNFANIFHFCSFHEISQRYSRGRSEKIAAWHAIDEYV